MCAYQGYLPVSNSERDITYDSVEIEVKIIELFEQTSCIRKTQCFHISTVKQFDQLF